jgi:hypothetical protein
MGRGLSQLQRWALCKAYRNHVDEGRVPVAATIAVCDDGSVERAEQLCEVCKALGIQPSHIAAVGWRPVIVPKDPDAYREAKTKLLAAGMKLVESWEWPTRLPDGRWQEGADLFAWEVLVEFYGLEPNFVSPLGFRACLPTRQRPGYEGTKLFSRADQQVNAAMAATSRAFARLGQRGLVFVGFAGVHLTRQGIEEAKCLMANGVDNVNTDNR